MFNFVSKDIVIVYTDTVIIIKYVPVQTLDKSPFILDRIKYAAWDAGNIDVPRSCNIGTTAIEVESDGCIVAMWYYDINESINTDKCA